MAENNCSNIIDSLLKGMESVMASKTVVGEPTNIGDTVILPLYDVSFAVGAGATIAAKNDKSAGGGGGMSGKMSPSAVLVIKDGNARLINVKNQDALTKAIDMIPDIVDKFTKKKDEKNDIPSDEEAINIAFSDK